MKRSRFFMVLAGIPAAFTLATTLLANAGPATALLGLILLIIGMVVSLFSYVGLMVAMEQESMIDWRAALSAARGKVLSVVWAAILVAIVTMIGYILLVLPGIYFSVLFMLYPFAVVLEGKRGWSAAERSKELVKGRWWHVFGRLFVAGLILGLIYMIALGIAGIIDESYILPIVQFVLTVVITPISVAFSYLVFKHLKANPVVVAPAPAPAAQPMA